MSDGARSQEGVRKAGHSNIDCLGLMRYLRHITCHHAFMKFAQASCLRVLPSHPWTRLGGKQGGCTAPGVKGGGGISAAHLHTFEHASLRVCPIRGGRRRRLRVLPWAAFRHHQ
eukprot:8660292-Pyramimonas_sp.AAC.1